jgi:hypothetical protein
VQKLPEGDVAPDLRWYITPCGIGDYLCVFMAVGAYLRKWPNAIAHIAYWPCPAAECILGWDRVAYTAITDQPEGYWDILQQSSRRSDMPWWLCGCNSRKTWFDRLGLDWERKRMYYRITPDEEQFASDVWGPGRPRVSLQWHGGGAHKTYSHMRDVYDWFEERGANVVGLDQRGVSGGHGRALRGDYPIREMLSIPATADMHIGICSGPSYAAIGSNVPTVILLPYDDPDEIFGPLESPPVWSHLKFSDIEGIPLSDILRSCEEMWDHVVGNMCGQGAGEWRYW